MRGSCGTTAGPAITWGIVPLVVLFASATGCERAAVDDTPWRGPGIEFSALADRFLEDSGRLTDLLNRAHASGDFAAISESAVGVIISLSDTVAKMEALVPQLHTDLTTVAAEIASAGRGWTEATSLALRAGLASDAALFAETRGVLGRERERFNLAVRKWNVAVEGS